MRAVMMSFEPPAISPPWLSWLLDFRAAASELISTATAEPSTEGDLELQSIRFALYARALTLFDTACLLAQNDKLLDIRNYCRGIVECAIHMAASQSHPGYVKAVKDDDKVSRRSRAKSFSKCQAIVDRKISKLLNDFLGHDFSGMKQLKISDLADYSNFARLLHVYREISADAAHVTFTSL